MQTEQTFIDLIKEGRVSDAVETIKEELTKRAGEQIVEEKFSIAEQYGMKKKTEESSDEDDDDSEKEEDEESESDKE